MESNNASASLKVTDIRFARKVQQFMPGSIQCRAHAVLTPGPTPEAVDNSYTEIVQTIYGKLLVPRFDTHQTPALRGGYGLSHELVIELEEKLKRRTDPIFLDIGANVGQFGFCLQKHCAKVHMYEPQRILFNMLCGSVALNGWYNVYVHNLAISNEIGRIEIPQFDYGAQNSFGSIEFDSPEQRERLQQERQYEADRVERVQTAPIDYFQFPRVDCMKIDVEGMEFKVIEGARETIQKHHPLILIEYGKVHKQTLGHMLHEFGYRLHDYGWDFLAY